MPKFLSQNLLRSPDRVIDWNLKYCQGFHFAGKRALLEQKPAGKFIKIQKPSKMKTTSLLPTFALALSFGISVHAAPLLTDNFNSPSFGASTFNNSLATDQAGSLATLTYTTSAPGGDWSTQHGNGGTMLIANGGNNNWVSLNHDFSIEANLANKPLIIQFDAWVSDAAHGDVWLGFGLDSTQGTYVENQKYWTLVRKSAGTHTYKFVFSDTAGTGSAFNGVTDGAKVEVFIDGISQGSTTRTLNPGDGFITFQQDRWDGYSIGHVDNLSIEMETSFPANETLTWTGTSSATWDETTPNWTNVSLFTHWFNNASSTNNALFDATGAAQPNVNFSFTRPLLANTITFDVAGYNVGGTVTLGNSPTFVTNADAVISATLQGARNITKSGLATLALKGSNSYSGVTIIEDGVLNAASFSDFGVDGSLGNRAPDIGEEIGLLFQGGTLQYTGSTAQSTNRTIRVGLEGATIDASGSVPAATLSFTAATSSNFFFAPGDRTITFTGTNTGENIFAMAIPQAGGSTSVVKNGPGTWILSGANTYTGTTTVNAGTLTLTSAHLGNTSSVIIGSTGTLDLDYSGNDVIGSLDINGSGPLPGGIYNSSHPVYGGHFTGTGSLLVLSGADSTWTALVNGIWDDPANWLANTIATGFNQTATFNAASGVTVTLDAPKTIGNLVFDVSDYTIAGSSALTLDAISAPAIGVGAGRTVTLTANVAGNLGLEKTGDGKLVFTGSKSYTGGTMINGGTLELFGATGGVAQIHGSVNVGPGATLAFTNGDGTGFGFANNPVDSITVDGGTINAVSGSHLGFGATMSLTLQNGANINGSWQWNGDTLLSVSCYGDITNTIAGNLSLRADGGTNHTFYVDDGLAATDLHISANLMDQWPDFTWSIPSALTKDGSGTLSLSGTNTYDGNTIVIAGALEVTPTGSLHFRPTTNGSTNVVIGSPSAALSFLGTIDLDLNAVDATVGNTWSLIDLASFSSAALSPSAVTSTLGTFTQVSPGTWELSVTGAKWVFTTIDGNLAYASVSASDYDTWKLANGVIGTPADDDDNDGLSNHDEYAFGLDPTDSASINPIVVPLDAANGTLSYTRRNASLTTLSYSIWYSTDLSTGSWQVDVGAVQGSPSLDENVETVPVSLSNGLLSNPSLFIQIRAD